MRYPTEEEILAIQSELEASSNFHHQNTDAYGPCEMCAFETELIERTRKTERICEIDKLMINLVTTDMTLGITVATAGPELMHSLVYVTRVAFYCGLKAGLMQSTSNLEDLVKGE
jgi:hypothetical protein